MVIVTIGLTVHDETAFRTAARNRALADGLDPEEAENYLDPDAYSLGACAQMILDPGVSPDGAQIEYSEGIV